MATLDAILQARVDAAKSLGMTVERQPFGSVLITFQSGAWYVDPEVSDVLLQGPDCDRYDAEYKSLCERFEDAPFADLQILAAIDQIDLV